MIRARVRVKARIKVRVRFSKGCAPPIPFILHKQAAEGDMLKVWKLI